MAAEESGPVVTTTRGSVQGRVVDGQARFLGIPYAAPPVGALRWRPPEPPAPWTGLLHANAFGKSCPQADMDARHDEACLFLNVFTPDALINARARLPVMVWIPGGGLISGESNDYDGSKLARHGVVVVTLNYRVGVLGFFAQSNIDREGHSFANYGMMDQRFALAWVRDNIAAFGGDPSNVTIFGESAGGGSVFAQMASPKAVGLFHKSIAESGAYVAVQNMTVTRSLSLVEAETIGRYFSMAAGCPDLSVACLRNVPLQTVVKLQPNYQAGFIIDGELLPLPFAEAFQSGHFMRVPVLNGTTLDEWRWFIALYERISGQPVTPDSYPATISSYFSPSVVDGQFISVEPSEVLEQYPLSSYGSASEALAAAITDATMACSALKMDNWLARYVPTYAFEFTYRDAPMYWPKASFPYGAAHTIELQFLFPGFRWGPEATAQLLNTQEQALSDRMVDYWTTFAKTGVPVSASSGAWPKFKSGAQQMMLLNIDPSRVDNNFAARHRCAFWEEVSTYDERQR